MTIRGFPLSAKLPEDLSFGERFWYWRGASGRNYIHSVYDARACPPLPGAVYVAVRREGATRRALATGRFPNFWDGSVDGVSDLVGAQADEIHVHLLSRNEREANMVSEDLGRAMFKTASSYPALIAA